MSPSSSLYLYRVNLRLHSHHLSLIVSSPNTITTIVTIAIITIIIDPTLQNLIKFILSYSLCDLSPSEPDPGLDQLPILPLSNGQIAKLRIYTPQQATAIETLFSFGFSVNQALYTLEQVRTPSFFYTHQLCVLPYGVYLCIHSIVLTLLFVISSSFCTHYPLIDLL